MSLTTTLISPLIHELIQEILKINKLQRNFLSSSLQTLSENDANLFTRYLMYCLNQQRTLEYLARCYDLIAKDTFKQQLYFKRHGKYKYSSYTEVESLVYQNEDYMNMYMHGLAITTFLWPNHVQMKSFFKEKLPKQQTGKYLEIGPGHGFHMMEAMQIAHYDEYLGVDISPTSVVLTQNILSSHYLVVLKTI